MFQYNTIDYKLDRTMHPDMTYVRNDNLLTMCTRCFNPRPSDTDADTSPVWYGFAYFLADTDNSYRTMRKIADITMMNPTIPDYSIEDLKPIPNRDNIVLEEELPASEKRLRGAGVAKKQNKYFATF